MQSRLPFLISMALAAPGVAFAATAPALAGLPP
jgi:hypothetical protein